jgi:hypothetical protein
MNAKAWIIFVWIVGIVGYPGILMFLPLDIPIKAALFVVIFCTQPPLLVGEPDFTIRVSPRYTLRGTCT